MDLYSYALEAIKIAEKAQIEYVDVRIENEFESTFSLRNGIVSSNNVTFQEGIGIRVLFQESWGFAATSTLDRFAIKNAVHEAINCARKKSKGKNASDFSLAKITARETKVSDSYKTEPQFVDPSERIDLASLINSAIISQVDEVQLLDIKLVENQTQKIFLNSEGSDIEQNLVRSSLFLGTTLQRFNAPQKVVSTSYGGVGGLEQFSTKKFDSFLKIFVQRLPKIAKARAFKPQKAPVILNEDIAWNLCHEFCHAVEYDLILEGASPLKNNLGQKLGSERVTIIDDASFPGFGQYYFDDEGVKASGTLIMEDGILYDFLQNRETAGLSNTIPTSNGRAQSFFYPPQVRQSNTFFEPGDFTFEELLQKVDNGYYVCNSFGGHADTVHGNFQLDAQYARKIENGELSDYVTGFSLAGNLYTILGKITGLTKNIRSAPAYCGKNGQQIAVGAISPKISLHELALMAHLSNKAIQKINLNITR